MSTPSSFWPILSLIVGVIAWVLVARGSRGNLVGPFSILLFILVSIFAARPLFMLADNDYQFYGIGVASGFNTAAFIGFLAIVSASLGYIISPRTDERERQSVEHVPAGPNTRSFSMYRSSLVCITLVAMWFAIMSIRGGGIVFISSLYSGRSAATSAVIAGLPVAVGGLPVAGALIASVVRVSIERERHLYPAEQVAFWVSVLLTTVPPLALGTRRYLLPCLLAAAIATIAPKYWHPVRARYFFTAFVAFLFLSIVPFIRSAGSRRHSTDLAGAVGDYFGTQGIFGSIKPFFTSYDTEMFSYISALVPRLGRTIPFGLGRGTLGDAFLNPFPASSAPFPLWSDRILTTLFGGGCAEKFCPVPSVVGVLYYDFAFPGVIVGCFLIGWACRQYPLWLAGRSGLRLVIVLGIAAFTPVLFRGNTVNVAYIAALTIGIAAAGMQFCGKAKNEHEESVVRPSHHRGQPASPHQ